jgi:hypothetical protein
LPKRSRPEAIDPWLRSHKRNATPPLDATTFGLGLVQWWAELQSTWRISDGTNRTDPLTLIRGPKPANEKWSTLRKGGSSGFYLIIVALSWWASVLDGVPSPLLLGLLDDVEWVLSAMVATMPEPPIAPSDAPTPSSSKWNAEASAEDDSGRGKRVKK